MKSVDSDTRPTQREPDESLDCEAAEISLAARQHRTLTLREAQLLDQHLATCSRCRSATTEDESRWLVRIARDQFAAGPHLPIVDPDVFVVERELATGGMGRVSLATDRRLGRQVALKEILDPSLRIRFEREALITAHLQHPAIVPIYEAGTWPDGSAFYAMRLVVGTTLHEAIAAARTLEARLALLHHVTAVVEAIAYAHGRRVVHRDLKTTNVLVGEFGDTVVIDWGLAKQLDDEDLDDPHPIPRSGPDLTRAGAVMGTPGFMAPEQARGEATDERADVFSLGAILYTLLAGTPPYLEAGAEAAIGRTALGPALPLSDEAPADLRAICEKAMAHQPSDRYPTARELASELRRFEAGQLIARTYTIRELVVRWFRRHRALVIGGAISLLAVAVIGTLAIVNVTQSRGAERDARREAELALVEARDAKTKALAGEAAALEEQARTALMRGERDPALVLLHQALAQGRDTPSLRYLLASALRDRSLLGDDSTSYDKVIAATGNFGAPFVIDNTGAVRRGSDVVFQTSKHPVEAVFSGTDLVVVQDEDRSLACWNLETKALVWRHRDQAATDSAGTLQLLDKELVVFAGDGEKTLTVRTLATGALVKQLTFPDPIKEVAIGGGWSWVLAVGGDKTVTIYREDDDPWIPSRTIAGEERRRLAVLDSDHVVTSADSVTKIWDARDARKPTISFVHDGDVRELVANSRSELIVTLTDRGTLQVWGATGVLRATTRLPNSSRSAPDLVLSRNGAELAIVGDEGVTIWKLPGLQEPFRLPGNYRGLSWGSGGFLVADKDLQLRSLRTPSFGILAATESGGSAIDGDHVVVAGGIAINKRGRHTRAEIEEIPSGRWQASTTGHRLLVDLVNARDPKLLLVDLTTGRVITKLFDQGVVALAPDGSLVAVAREANDEPIARLQIASGVDGAILHELPMALPNALAFLGTDLVVLSDTVATLLNPETLIQRPFATVDARSIHVTANRRVVLFGQRKVTVHSDTGTLLFDLQTSDHANSVTSSRDGRWIAVQVDSGAIEIFDLSRRDEMIARIPPCLTGSLAISSDGARVFTGNADGTVRVFETSTGRELEIRNVHHRPIRHVSLFADDSVLLADTYDIMDWPPDSTDEQTATMLDVAVDRSPLSKLAEHAKETGWRFVDGTVRPTRP